MSIKITDYKDEYSSYFYDLNVEWLKKYFYVEKHDEEVLSNPKKFIIENGGVVLFAKYNDTIV